MKATKTPGQVLRRHLPGRMQVQLNFYNSEKRVHRPVPAHTITFSVQNPNEARRLFAALRGVVEAEGWRDDPSGGADAALAGGGALADRA
jgi:hypothetical protein